VSDELRERAVAILESVNGCKEHASDIRQEDIAEVVAAHSDDYREHADTDGIALVRLTSGDYAVLTEWGDSSGHG
jgi:hypothetical protein